MQITAHLDDSYQEKLKAIRAATDIGSVDEIVQQALDMFYEKTALTPKEKNRRLVELLAGTAEGPENLQTQPSENRLKALLESDFVGCAEGPEDLSVNYKEYLYQGLKQKHGLD